MFLFWKISHRVVMMFVLIVSGLFFSLSYLNTTFHQPQYSFYWYFLFCLCISLTSIVRLISPGWISSSSSVRRERSSKCNIWPCGGQYWTHFTRPWNNLLRILPYFYKPSYTLCPCAYYVSNLFLIVGQHDHVAHPVLEGHSPEVQHCVLFWTLNNEDFEGIQSKKSAITAKKSCYWPVWQSLCRLPRGRRRMRRWHKWMREGLAPSEKKIKDVTSEWMDLRDTWRLT